MKRERWVFTDKELAESSILDQQDMFIAVVVGEEVGVIVYRNGKVSNLWEDGTAGVPKDVAALADDQESLLTLDRSTTADNWRDVDVDVEDGNLVRII